MEGARRAEVYRSGPAGRNLGAGREARVPDRADAPRRRAAYAIALLVPALLAAACGEAGPPGSGGGGGPPPTRLAPVAVSGPSPFAPGCEGAPQSGTVYPSSEVEPWVAADPAAPGHLFAVWQQDRFSNAGARGLLGAVSFDGGRSWAPASAPFTRCTGGTPAGGGDFERASDPWVTFSPDGTAYQASLSFQDPDRPAAKAVLVSRSRDGGRTWGDPATLASDSGHDVALDKESITADPYDARYVYATWDRLDHLSDPDPARVTGPAWFARTGDGGASWEAARVIHDPGPDAQTISNQIVALPGGALVDVFVLVTRASQARPDYTVAVLRSPDRGVTWSAPIPVGRVLAAGARDPAGHPIRSGIVVPAVAADPAAGVLHVAWEDARFGGGTRDGVVLATSADGGLTWSAPRQVHQAPAAQAFRPSLAVAPGGALALTYHDDREGAGRPAGAWITVWLATSRDGGDTWQELALGEPFDLRLAPDVTGDGWFVGDYTGLVADGDGFVAVFAATAPGDPAGIRAARLP